MRVALMFAVFAVAVPDRPDPTPREAKTLADQLLGNWQSVRLIVYGNVNPPNQQDGDHTTIDRGRWVSFKQGIQKDGMPTTYTIDITKSPAVIDFVVKQGAMDIKLIGIIKIEGDLLTVCYVTDRLARPTEFASAPNSQTSLLEMKRLKK